jgi:ABC-2 type transport system ATP-binding protein
MSKGQRRRVQLVLAMAHRPRLLLLDEPTDGLDHVVRDTVLALLAEHLADHPTTVLLSTHRVYEVERLVDTVGILAEGRLLGQFTRATMNEQLLRYWTDVPPDWDETRPVDAHVIRRHRGRREVEWLAWGPRAAVAAALERAGAEVRDVTPVSIDDAATAILSHREAS